LTVVGLVFIALFFSALAALGTALAAAFRGRRASADRILLRLAIATAAYLALVSLVSIRTPRRVFKAGEPQCNGEWCLAVAGVDRRPAGGGLAWRVTLRLYTTAKRVAMGENGVEVYLLDGAGRSYPPLPDPADIPLNVRIAPGASVTVERQFLLPAGAAEPALVVHFGAGPGLVIGEVHWFRQPDIMRLL